MWDSKLVSLFLVAACLCGASRGLASGSHLYDGLDYCLPSDIAQRPIFIPYEVTFTGPNAIPPVFGQMAFYKDNQVNRDRDFVVSVLRNNFLPDRHGLFVPPSAGVKVNWKDNVPLWEFPPGTTFVHEIDFMSKIFEVRILKRIGLRWAFRAYTPSTNGPCANNLRLRVDSSDPRFLPDDVEYKTLNILDKNNGAVTVRYQPMPPIECWKCHSDMNSVGPCHFGDPRAYLKVPDIQADSASWIEQFTLRFGHSPLN